MAPIWGRTGLRQVDQGNIVHASDATGIVLTTQTQPIAVWFSLPQQQINQVNAAFAKASSRFDVFGNDGRTVVQNGMLASIDNEVDPTTETLKLAQFPNADLQLWPGEFANVRLRSIRCRTRSWSRRPRCSAGLSVTYTTSSARTTSPARIRSPSPADHVEAVITGVSTSDRVDTTGFANLSDGARIIIGSELNTPSPDLAPRRKGAKGQKDAKDKAREKGADAGTPPATSPAGQQGGTLQKGQGQGAKQRGGAPTE